jgi:hypothetical protein
LPSPVGDHVGQSSPTKHDFNPPSSAHLHPISNHDQYPALRGNWWFSSSDELPSPPPCKMTSRTICKFWRVNEEERDGGDDLGWVDVPFLHVIVVLLHTLPLFHQNHRNRCECGVGSVSQSEPSFECRCDHRRHHRRLIPGEGWDSRFTKRR